MKLSLSRPGRHIRRPDVQLHSFLTSAPVVTFLVSPLYLQQITLVLIEQEAAGLLSWSGWFWRRENLFPLPRFEPQPVQPVASSYIIPALEVTKYHNTLKPC
jgi:hypothetical protein